MQLGVPKMKHPVTQSFLEDSHRSFHFRNDSPIELPKSCQSAMQYEDANNSEEKTGHQRN